MAFDQNAAWRRWYANNKRKKIGWQRRRVHEIQRWWAALKATKACERCGESAPECLHFHHRDPRTKKFTLSVAATNGRSRAVLLDEVAKCIVLCGNCHLIQHWEERQKKGSG